MDLIDKLQALSAKIKKQKDAIQTEEATKNAFVLPFIGALGYDVFDPEEVIPEFTADWGTKKGEKIDFAIKIENKVVMLIECKSCNSFLDDSHASQLFRYFSTLDARLAVLTDGVRYRFYSDIEEKNKMDSTPFMEFNLLNVQQDLIPELKRLTKQSFNLQEIVLVAGDLKYTGKIKRLCSEQFQNPSEEFVAFFAKQVLQGGKVLTKSVREQFTAITKRALTEFLNDTINNKLRSAMAQSTPPVTVLPQPGAPTEGAGEPVVASPPSRSPERREEELEGFYIVKAILSQVIDPKRIGNRDTANHFNIRLDESQKKTICRLGLEKAPKYVVFISEQKEEERVPIETVSDLFRHADRLKATVAFYERTYDKGKAEGPAGADVLRMQQNPAR
jgi:hypothetical protein